MITVSSNAKDYISRLLAEGHKDEGTFIRVGIKAGGCSGLEYQMNFDTETKTGDQVFEDKGIRQLTTFPLVYGTMNV